MDFLSNYFISSVVLSNGVFIIALFLAASYIEGVYLLNRDSLLPIDFLLDNSLLIYLDILGVVCCSLSTMSLLSVPTLILGSNWSNSASASSVC